ncbi:MAG: T9SS type A sorting domain-containing protein [Ferruginibacter sp.]|nr:T9SS type A sorting domain-containing protein [Ferruginibacter sp.]
MKRTTLICFSLIIGVLLPEKLLAQSVIDFSKYTGGSGEENVTKMQVVNGETYMVGSTTSANFPVTNGSTYKGNTDLVITKYGINGNILFSTYLGSLGYDNFYAMKIINSEVYLLGTADSIGYPVTNGSTFKGKTDIVLTKLNAAGSITFSTYLGGLNNDYPSHHLSVIGNQVIIGGSTESTDFPVTGGSYYGGLRDGFVTKINTASGVVTRSVFIGGSLEDFIDAVYEENGFIYLIGTSFSMDLPVTIGNSPGTARNIMILKLATGNFNTVYYRYLGGSAVTTGSSAVVLNGEVHISGFTFSQNFPVTNGSSFSGLPGDYIDGFYTRLNSDGSIRYSTLLGTSGADFFNQVVLSNGEAFLAGISSGYLNAQQWEVVIFKINSNGSFGYTKKLGLGLNYQLRPSVIALNGDLYVAGITNTPDFPVTNGSQYYSGGTGYFTHLDPAGNILYSSFLGRMNSILPMENSNSKFYLLGQTAVESYPVTDSSVIKGEFDNILTIIEPDGTNVFGSYIGGSLTELPSQLAVDNNNVYISGITNSVDYPTTNNFPEQGISDQFFTRLSFCPSNYDLSTDTLSPKIQTVCKLGLGQLITGEKITIAASNLPLIFLNGLQSQQVSMIEAIYQWQVANSLPGSWTDIPGATFKDYRPVPGELDQYYRRLSFASSECGSAFIHTSDTASAIVNNLNAPAINTVGVQSTCPGSAVTIGGSPTVTGGNPPYTSYMWDMGAATVSNPTVSPANSTIYTLIVTDAAGCMQIGQAPVFIYRANAGVDKSNCAGAPVKIGTAPIPGISGITYTWQPSATLTASNIAQPFANPISSTNYELTLTLVKSDGSSCSTNDAVSVTPVEAPLTANFAGPDKVICLKSSASLGTPPEAGFTYTWSPGSYLQNNTNATTTYYAGNILIPTPDPAVLNLTAQKNGCSFSDQVVVATIESRAGLLACGPRLVGLPDRTANINETYLWSRISGPGNFTGATNLPQVPVSASIGGTTIYGLQVTYNGASCFSQVSVPEICIGCNTRITVDAKYKCPSFGVNAGDVTLNASSNLQNPVFTWTPQSGLSAYAGNSVQLTDNIPRTYTVTATELNDTSQHCSFQVIVNDPAFSLPLFTAPDTVACANIPIVIGQAPIAGYNYLWTGPGLSSNTASNPTATIPFETVYPVKITDGNGCEITDTVVVQVQNVLVNAGEDYVVCSNAVISLGTPPQPNTTYLWEPQSSPWQNGTSQFSAQPEVLVATNVTYTVTATTPAGCISFDQVAVNITNIPTIPGAADTIVCLGNNVRIGSPSLPGVVYQWTPSTGLNNATIAQPLASPVVTTTYSLVAIFPGSCAAAATDQVTVVVSNPSFNLPNISYCPGNGALQLGNAAPANMFSYSWAPQLLVTNPFIANPNTLDPPPDTNTALTLTVVNTAGCIYTDTTFLFPVSTNPIAGPDKAICKNQATTIGSPANTSGLSITYNWSPVTNLDNPAVPNPIFTGNTGGSFIYILTKTDNNISCSTRDTLVITVTDSLLPVLNAATVCRNSCVQIGTTPLPGVQYQWTPATGLSNAAIANPLACVGAETVSYTLTANDVNGCSSSATVVVGVNGLTSPQVVVPAITACVGDNSPVFNPVVSPNGSYSYLWSPDNATLSNVNILSPAIQIGGAGSLAYTLQVTDSNTGCTNIAIGNVTVNNCSAFAVVGDFIWFDTNSDGIQDIGEPGVSGMIVKLYNNVDFNIATTVTDADGLYLFNNIPAGNDYYVVFSAPAGFIYTLPNIGGVGASDNSKAGTNGRSNNFNVLAGASILSIDAGIIPEGCGPVPVTLLSFTGRIRNKEVLLNWQTTAEYNNHYFDIERSNSANNFFKIGRANGNGTTAVPHSYSFPDLHPLPGINYYRLKQVDFDNRSSYSNTVPIEFKATESLSAYYSITDNTVHIIFNEKQDDVHLKLFANNGQLVYTATASGTVTNYNFALPALASGIYIIQLLNDRLNYTKKIFIQ